MGTYVSATIASRRPRHPQGPVDAGSVRDQVVAMVIRRDDGTCAVVGPGSGRSWSSLSLAKRAVEDMAPLIGWHRTARGVWVAVTPGATF